MISRHIVHLDFYEMEKLLGLPEGLRVEVVRESVGAYTAPGLDFVISGPGMSLCPVGAPLYIERWAVFKDAILGRMAFHREMIEKGEAPPL
jgi:hypothetical protein